MKSSNGQNPLSYLKDARPAGYSHGHGSGFRKEEGVPHGVTVPRGRFGRMFENLPPLVPPEAPLEALAKALNENSPADPSQNNDDVPAGYTYLGQFIDHDITFDPTPMPEKQVDPLAIFNFRTPRLDLDSLYGIGPDQPYLYDRDSRAKLLIGKNPESDDVAGRGGKIPEKNNDLPRNSQGFALIGDPRNDENLVVAQLHLAFLKFHNAVVDHLEPEPAKQLARFDEARRIVTWTYQWLVVNDFLGRLLQKNAVQDVLDRGRQHFRFEKEPFIPVEFSVAAYRFGHSMIRNGYNHNRVFNFQPGALAPATLELLFRFTGPARPDGSPSAPVPSNWVIDWRRFFKFPKELGEVSGNSSRLLDPFLAPVLANLRIQGKVSDKGPDSLVARNLRRGARVGLPSGQRVARAMRIAPLPREKLESGPDGEALKKANLSTQTPLWFYVMKEAQVLAEGRRLGPVGSKILAEVFVGLLQGDPNSYLSQDPDWTPPTNMFPPNGIRTMADLITFTDKNSPLINPIGD